MIAVEEDPVRMTQMEIRRAFAQIEPSRFDAAGFIVPHGDFLSDMVALGLTAADCRRFGRWANPHRIVFVDNGFRYETDDVSLTAARLFHRFVSDGMDEDEAAARVHHPEVLGNLRSQLHLRPDPWL